MPTRGWLVACSVTWLCLSSCSGQEFVSTSDGGGSSGKGGSDSAGKAAGGSDSGATGGTNGGDSSNAGAPDPGGSGGSGGTVTTGCDCPAGHYCRDNSTDCFDCAELNRLRFSPPERLATLSENGQGSTFPRVGMTATDLVYVLSGTGMRYTTDSSTSPGGSVKTTMPLDSAPLLLGGSVSGMGASGGANFNFVFDRVVEGTRRQLFGGQWNNGLQIAAALPPPFNSNTGNGDYSMAIALHPNAGNMPRAYWMARHDAGASATLVTALFGAAMTGTSVTLAVGAPKCTPLPGDADLAPWVTNDGKTLFFSHTRIDANCQAVGQGKDLYTTLLQPADGQPPAQTAALPMNDVNSTADDVQPSFSADLCDLYFASNRDGDYAVYRAHRR